MKEIQLSPNIASNDLGVKFKRAVGFLEKKKQVKLVMIFKGRENKFVDRGELVMLKFIEDLLPYGKVQFMPKLDGKKMVTVINPKK